jgi:hypothetical protein
MQPLGRLSRGGGSGGSGGGSSSSSRMVLNPILPSICCSSSNRTRYSVRLASPSPWPLPPPPPHLHPGPSHCSSPLFHHQSPSSLPATGRLQYQAILYRLRRLFWSPLTHWLWRLTHRKSPRLLQVIQRCCRAHIEPRQRTCHVTPSVSYCAARENHKSVAACLVMHCSRPRCSPRASRLLVHTGI